MRKLQPCRGGHNGGDWRLHRSYVALCKSGNCAQSFCNDPPASPIMGRDADGDTDMNAPARLRQLLRGDGMLVRARGL